jgi:hypothetical protein
VPTVIIAEEEMILRINGDSLMSVGGHREDSDVAGKRTLEEGILSTIQSAAIDCKRVGDRRGLRNIFNRSADVDGCSIVDRGCGRDRDWLRCGRRKRCRFSYLELWGLASDPSKYAPDGAACGSASWLLQGIHLRLIRAGNRPLLMRLNCGLRAVAAGRRGCWLLIIGRSSGNAWRGWSDKRYGRTSGSHLGWRGCLASGCRAIANEDDE